MTTEITIEVELEGTIIHATEDKYVDEHWLPGEPADVADFKVLLTFRSPSRGRVMHTEYLDITKALDEMTIEKLKNEYIEMYEDEDV